MPGAAIRLDAELMSNRSSAPIGLSLAALDRRLGHIKCRLLLCSSADSATARPHKSPSLLRNASTRWYFAGPAVLTYVPTPAVSTNQLSRSCSAEAPRPAGPGPTEQKPRSHRFDLTHQVRVRVAKRARHRRGHLVFPPRMETSGEVGQLLEALREANPGRAAMRQQKAGTVRELEVGSRRDIWVIGSHRQAGQQEAEWLDGLEHEPDSGVSQDLALFGRLMAKGEVARDHL